MANRQDIVAGRFDALSQQVESFSDAGSLQRVLGLITRYPTEEILDRRGGLGILHLGERVARFWSKL